MLTSCKPKILAGQSGHQLDHPSGFAEGLDFWDGARRHVPQEGFSGATY